jgi:hypothetical protein
MSLQMQIYIKEGQVGKEYSQRPLKFGKSQGDRSHGRNGQEKDSVDLCIGPCAPPALEPECTPGRFDVPFPDSTVPMAASTVQGNLVVDRLNRYPGHMANPKPGAHRAGNSPGSSAL